MNPPTPARDGGSSAFHALRPRLQGIAYRMLGTLAEAEEVVQDAWLRWHDAQADPPGNAEAWLVTVTTRLAIDRLRAAKLQREHYTGMWLPEPVLTDSPDSPEALLERAGEMSVALLRLMERLSPESRAAFVLREVLDVDYPELARIVDKSEAACRQLVSRAKKQLADGRPRYVVSPGNHHRVLSSFARALLGGNFESLKAMLAEEAELVGDGGGKVQAFPQPVVGGVRIAQVFFAAHLRLHERQQIRLVQLNGEWGLLRFIDGALETALTVQVDGERIVAILAQRNPDKLARLAAACHNGEVSRVL